MASIELTLNVQPYFCEPCHDDRGEVVQALVRMVPKAVVMNGKMIGDEWYCCPVCFDKKFPVRNRKKPAATKRKKAIKPELRVV